MGEGKMVWQDEDDIQVDDFKEETGAGGRSLLSRGRFFLLGAAIAAALGIVMYIGFRSTAIYYLSVGELLERGDAAYGERVRLGGKVLPGSINQDAVNRMLEFTVTDEEGRGLPVSYQGVVPDAFEEGGEVVLEGRLSEAGLFKADTLLAKCPSKFSTEAEASGNARP
jgi:cytochrome c-type biogenesis protein CcmE